MKKILSFFLFALLLCLAVSEGYALATQPSVQAKNITFSGVTTENITVTCTKGNGAYRLIVAAQATAWNNEWNPVDGTDYDANAAFGSGDQIGTGGFVVYEGTGRNVTVTGLNSGTAYIFKVFEFNGTGTETNYYDINGTNNPRATITVPSNPSGLAMVRTGDKLGDRWFTVEWNNMTGNTFDIIVDNNSGFGSPLNMYNPLRVSDIYYTDGDLEINDDISSNSQYYWEVRSVVTNTDITPPVTRTSEYVEYTTDIVWTRPVDLEAADLTICTGGSATIDPDEAADDVEATFTWAVYGSATGGDPIEGGTPTPAVNLEDDATWVSPVHNTTGEHYYYAEWVSDASGLSSTYRTKITVTVEESVAKDVDEEDETPSVCEGSNVTINLAETPAPVGDFVRWEFSANGGGLWTPLTVGLTDAPFGQNANTVNKVVTASSSLLTIENVDENIDGYWFRAVWEHGSCGEATSTNHADLTVLALPSTDLDVDREAATVCYNSGTNITVALSEVGVDYQLRDDADDTEIGDPVAGNGETINLPTGNMTAGMTFNVLAFVGESCSVELSETVSVAVEETPVAPTLATKTPDKVTVCQGTALSATFNAGSGGTADEYQYSIDNGSNWDTYTPGVTEINAGTQTVIIQGRRTGTVCSASEWATLATWAVELTPVSPTLTKSPDEVAVCDGVDVSATLNAAGVGGTSSLYQYAVNDGEGYGDWTTYNLGDPIETEGLTAVKIQAIQKGTECSDASANVYEWTINPLPAVTCPSSMTVCVDATPFNLNGNGENPTGGVFAGTGVTFDDPNYVFNPATATVGVHEITYTYTDGNGCQNSCTFNISVVALPTAYNVTGGGERCANGDGLAIGIDDSDEGVTYELLFDSNPLEPQVVINGTGEALNFGTFTNAGTYTVLATGAAPTSCDVLMTGSAVITVHALPTPNILGQFEVCSGNGSYEYTVQGGNIYDSYLWSVTGGTFSGNNDGATVFVIWDEYPAAGTISVTVSDDHGNGVVCYGSQNDVDVNIVEQPDASLPMTATASTICRGQQAEFTIGSVEQPTVVGVTYYLYDENYVQHGLGQAGNGSTLTFTTSAINDASLGFYYRASDNGTGCSNVSSVSTITTWQADLGDAEIFVSDGTNDVTNQDLCPGTYYFYINESTASLGQSGVWKWYNGDPEVDGLLIGSGTSLEYEVADGTLYVRIEDEGCSYETSSLTYDLNVKVEPTINPGVGNGFVWIYNTTYDYVCSGDSRELGISQPTPLGYDLGYPEGAWKWYKGDPENGGEYLDEGLTIELTNITENMTIYARIEQECKNTASITKDIYVIDQPLSCQFAESFFDIYTEGAIDIVLDSECENPEPDSYKWWWSNDDGTTWSEVVGGGNPLEDAFPGINVVVNGPVMQLEDVVIGMNNLQFRLEFINSEEGVDCGGVFNAPCTLKVYGPPEDCPLSLQFYNFENDYTTMSGTDLYLSWMNNNNGTDASKVLIVYRAGTDTWEFEPVNGNEYSGKIGETDYYALNFAYDEDVCSTFVDDVLTPNTNYTAYVYYYNGVGTGAVYADCFDGNTTKYIKFTNQDGTETIGDKEAGVAFPVSCRLLDRTGAPISENPTVEIAALCADYAPTPISPETLTGGFTAGVRNFNLTIKCIEGTSQQQFVGMATDYIPLLTNAFFMMSMSPTAQAGDIGLIERGTNWMKINWNAAVATPADNTKDGRILIVRQGSPTDLPVDGVRYTELNGVHYATNGEDVVMDWLEGEVLGNSYVMVLETTNAKATSLRINNMARTPSRTYYFRLCEFNDGGGDDDFINYRTTSGSFNPRSLSLPTSRDNTMFGVEIDGLTGRSYEGVASLSWNSITERGNTAFELYRQDANSEDFALVGSVEGLNSDAGKAYRFVDDKGLTLGETYLYKLVSVAVDGTREDLDEEYVTILSMPNVEANLFMHDVEPNPVTSALKFSIELATEQSTIIQISDISGRIIATLNNGNLKAGLHEFNYDMSGMAAGNYVITVTAGLEGAVQSFIFMP